MATSANKLAKMDDFVIFLSVIMSCLLIMHAKILIDTCMRVSYGEQSPCAAGCCCHCRFQDKG